jgi:hypothetical protein
MGACLMSKPRAATSVHAESVIMSRGCGGNKCHKNTANNVDRKCHKNTANNVERTEQHCVGGSNEGLVAEKGGGKFDSRTYVQNMKSNGNKK